VILVNFDIFVDKNIKGGVLELGFIESVVIYCMVISSGLSVAGSR